METHACRKGLVRREETDRGIDSVDGETGSKQSVRGKDRYGNRLGRWRDMHRRKGLVRGEKTDTGIGWEDGETCIEETIS